MEEKFILIEKDGFQISVNPGTLANHLELGWQVVDTDGTKVVKVETTVEKTTVESTPVPVAKTVQKVVKEPVETTVTYTQVSTEKTAKEPKAK